MGFNADSFWRGVYEKEQNEKYFLESKRLTDATNLLRQDPTNLTNREELKKLARDLRYFDKHHKLAQHGVSLARQAEEVWKEFGFDKEEAK
ncbi:hypothetical protein A3A95_03470 [Candidatus Nomurabacteria bacterium RIFCSPLOWO2_01_FULL_39_18]|uniref:Uncharacterized protein n=1 Tax=Candidatus Nomurabacteria bacterium RIFCSPHIGHO2_01_FULL_40_24b TaxID=1801739 RepID=A0A1F6V6E9_9BACT|nr:MAG: hypothetical protein A2647_05050 [Candidatus Nomurabacteria bacterium RIFCSPHIGHO2_01_FULL_40_24b]OGI89168.1 MAG: hypothetical protein A3A95_03470 [Candidatus Nomurabacteria bacterium RIFCSPLOWO2_01_FULL_39_18]